MLIDKIKTNLDQFNLPAYVYEEELIVKRINQLKKTFNGFDLLFSFKTNPNPTVIGLMKNHGVGADIASTAELELAVDSGIQGGMIYYSAPGKNDHDIKKAIQKCHLIANSFSEIDRIERICEEYDIDQLAIGIRINVLMNQMDEIDKLEVMSGRSSQFGIDEETILSSYEQFHSYKRVKIKGIHSYISSQILDENELIGNFNHVYQVAKLLKQQILLKLDYINFGGGFGVPYAKHERHLNLGIIESFIQKDLLLKLREDFGNIDFIIESGRFLVAEAGIYMSEIIEEKNSRGIKYLIIKGGMNGFFRPKFTGQRHPILVLKRFDQIEKQDQQLVTICGDTCTPLDVVAPNVLIDEAAVSDVLCFLNAGAYGKSMSLNQFISRDVAHEYMMKEDGEILCC